jgi:hypothetical protein
MRFVEYGAKYTSRPALDAAKAAAICASGRIFMIKGDPRRLRRIARALAAYPDVEVSPGPVALIAWPRGRGEELLPIGVRL